MVREVDVLGTLRPKHRQMDVAVVAQQSGPIALTEALAAARTYAERSLSESTRRGYARDLATFRAWCQARAVPRCRPRRRPSRRTLRIWH